MLRGFGRRGSLVAVGGMYNPDLRLRLCYRLWFCCAGAPAAGQLAVSIQDAAAIGGGFLEGDMNTVFVNTPFTCVIGGYGMGNAATVTVEQPAQVAGSTLNIFCRIETVTNSETFGCCRDQLHQAASTLVGAGFVLETAFGGDDGGDQGGVDAVSDGGIGDDIIVDTGFLA